VTGSPPAAEGPATSAPPAEPQGRIEIGEAVRAEGGSGDPAATTSAPDGAVAVDLPEPGPADDLTTIPPERSSASDGGGGSMPEGLAVLLFAMAGMTLLGAVAVWRRGRRPIGLNQH
jgi:hypothetical protein